MTLVVVGGSGLIGSTLVTTLREHGLRLRRVREAFGEALREERNVAGD